MGSSSLFLTSLLFSLSMATMVSANVNWTSTYIRASCLHTLYPGLCYASLSPFADQVGNDPVLLARVAMNVTISRLKPLSVRVKSLRRSEALAPSNSGNGAGGTLKDCAGLINDAADLLKKSEKEVTGLERKVGPQVTWCIANAQTWLSAALTDETTCTDEFSGSNGKYGGNEEEMEFVSKKLDRAQKLTSNALALVNCLVNS